jgi:hypothetical protein
MVSHRSGETEDTFIADLVKLSRYMIRQLVWQLGKLRQELHAVQKD